MGDETCVVCLTRTPTRPVVCDHDRKRIRAQLAELPTKMDELVIQLVPAGGTARGERVATSRTGSPTTARLDALTLLAPGSGEAVDGMLHPKVRKWRSEHTVWVKVGHTDDGATTWQPRQVTTWHQELVRDADGHPVHVVHDDQIGCLPPAEWLDSWTRTWRTHFGHRRPTHTGRGWPKDVDSARLRLAELTERQRAARIVLGLRDGHGGTAPVSRADPITDEWEIRFGEPDPGHAPTANVTYLLEWFDQACDVDLGIADFAAELRTLTGEISRVLGEQPDLQWLGRCPATLGNPDTGVERPCGAGLWQDPYVTQVTCPRCRTTWGRNKLELLDLARAIRRVWPLDRRRRYIQPEINRMTMPECPACGHPVDVQWRDVTGRGERQHSFNPIDVTCPTGCPDAKRLL